MKYYIKYGKNLYYRGPCEDCWAKDECPIKFSIISNKICLFSLKQIRRMFRIIKKEFPDHLDQDYQITPYKSKK